MKNIHILHISDVGGHSKAAQNIREALLYRNSAIEVVSLNGLGYFYPRAEKYIDFIYTATIKHFPRLWGRAYDRRRLVRALAPYRRFANQLAFDKLDELIRTYQPSCFVATQAFPCGVIADFKETMGIHIPLIGVVTDYHPNRFWVHPAVDRYIVACVEAQEVLIGEGISPEKVKILGIPISLKFLASYPRVQVSADFGFSKELNSVLIMGGGLGLGPFKVIAKELDMLDGDFQIIVVCGKNQRLHEWFLKHKDKFKKPIYAFGYTNQIHQLMDFADIIITKGGGITISEALAKGLCIIVTHPIPGQEERNVEYLLREKAILKADHARDTAALVKIILNEKKKMYALRERAKELSFIDSSLRIADVIFELVS